MSAPAICWRSRPPRRTRRHYYIGDLADVEEHLGNNDRSVELLADAYAKAKGPASRFQWGYNYLDGLLRLTPDDLATIEKVGVQVIAELDGPNRIHRRTLSRLNKLDAKLTEWNTSAERAKVANNLRARVVRACETSSGSKTGGCVSVAAAATT